MRLSSAIATVLVPLVSAQGQASTQAFTDPASGIAFQTFNADQSGVRFGIALPQGPSPDFIGHVSAPASLGWAAGNLGPQMIGKLLLVAWPAGQSVQGSVRLANRKSSPPEYPGAQMIPIAKGTYARPDGWQLTFLCKGCLANATVAFAGGAQQAAPFAWAASSQPPPQPASKSSPLTYHNAGTGQFSVALQAAASPKFADWAALAGAPAPAA